MALQLDQIRILADRVAASHQLEVVDLEFSGGAKHRNLRVFIEKDAGARLRLAQEATAALERSNAAELETAPDAAGIDGSLQAGYTDALVSEDAPVLPKGVPAEILSFVTHEDCVAFAQDFGTTLDVEDLVPGAEYTLEISSPGLERKLAKAADFARFTGLLVKLQTFTAIEGNRHFQGRLTAFAENTLTLDQGAIRQKGKPKKGAAPTGSTQVQVQLANVEKANLIAEI